MSQVRNPNALNNLKSNLDLAWAKTQDGLCQEAEGTNLWIEGTLELIHILDGARKDLGDQAFGKWLTDNGYGEDRISRHNRSALLNMAEHPDLTREVLNQTERRSYQYIWKEEIQPRLPYVRQPADSESPEANPANTAEQAADATPSEEAPAITRRPKRSKGAKRTREEWSTDLSKFFSDGLETARKATAIKNSIVESAPDKKADLQQKVTPEWLKQIEQGRDAFSWICDWANGLLVGEADTLIQKGRVIKTPPRASKQVQPEA
jgi:hypothetical protein